MKYNSSDKKKYTDPKGRRKFLRIDTVLPVIMTVILEDGEGESIKIQGFTRNVSQGGIGLEIHVLDRIDPDCFSMGHVHSVSIDVPYRKTSLRSDVKVVWKSDLSRGEGEYRLFLGLEFTSLSTNEAYSLERYALLCKRRPYLWGAAIFCLLFALFLSFGQYTFFKKVSVRRDKVISLKDQRIGLFEVERANLEKRRRNLAKRVFYFENKISEFEIKKTEGEEEILQLKERVNQYAMNEDKLVSQIQSLKNELEGTSAEDQKKTSDLKHKIDALEKNLQQVKRKAATFLEEKWSMEQSLDDLLKEKSKMGVKLEKVMKEKEDLNSKLETVYRVENWEVYKFTLMNGNSMTGELITKDDHAYYVKVAQGKMTFRKEQVKSLEPLKLKSKVELNQAWETEGLEAEKRVQKWKQYVREQKAKGLILHKGKWYSPEELKKLKSQRDEDKEKEMAFISKWMEKSESKTSPKVIKKQTPISSPKGVQIKGQRLYVDGKLFFIKGMAYGIEYPKQPGGMDCFRKIPRKVFKNDFKLMREMGVNVIRTYEPLNKFLLDLAYKNNIRVIETVCYPTEATDFSSPIHLEYHLKKAVKAVKKHKHHPAILCWALWNDAPWVWGKVESPIKTYGIETVNLFMKEIYKAVKEIDQDHPITAANVLDFSGSEMGFEFLDILGFNSYLGGLDWYIEEDAKRTMGQLIQIGNKYNKPVIITETGFSTFVEGLDQGEVLKKQLSMVGENLSGVVVFQWADGWQKAGYKDRQDHHIEEHWGILTGFRQAKPAFSTLKKIFSEIQTESLGWKRS